MQRSKSFVIVDNETSIEKHGSKISIFLPKLKFRLSLDKLADVTNTKPRPTTGECICFESSVFGEITLYVKLYLTY